MDVLQCGSSVNNVTQFDCRALYGAINAVMLSPVEIEMTYANALLESTFTALINATAASRTYIMPLADDAIRNQEDAVIREGNLSNRRKGRDGRIDFVLEYHDQRDCVWSKLKSFDNQRMYGLFTTENEAIIGGDDGTNLIGVPCDVFVSDPIPPENKDDVWKVLVHVYLIETVGNFAKAVLPNDSTYNTSTKWRPSNLKGIVDVVITEVSAAAGSVVVDLTGACDGREITGLVAADFSVTGLASLTSSGNTYTLSPTTTFTSPLTVTLANQPAMTTKGYENQTALTVTL